MSQRLIEGTKQLSRVVLNTVTQPANVISVPKRLPPLPTPKDLLRIYKIRARKHLKQKFILYKKINEKIVATSAIKNGDHVLELGSNVGAISRQILQRGPKQLVVMERDRRFLPMLEMLSDASIPGQMQVILGDVLNQNFDNIFPPEIASPWNESTPPVNVVANLPFNVAIPLIIRWVDMISKQNGLFKLGRVPLTITFQKEIAERIVAPVLDLRRSRLSIMCQNWCDVKMKFDIDRKYFFPKPNVDVSIVKFVPRKTPQILDVNFETLNRFCRNLFLYRTKYIRNCTEIFFPKELQHLNEQLYTETGINPEIGCTWLSVQEIGQLINVYLQICKDHPGLEEYDHRAPKKKIKKV